MIRDDLIALTPDVLAALSNRGLVKRATKEVDAGERPALAEDADGAVRAAYPDGVTVTLPVGGGLAAGICSCPAPGVCRHLLAVVLTYQRTPSAMSSSSRPCTHSTRAVSSEASPSATVPW
ncbi:hypothetical protein ACISRB_32950, partial [Micromonospora aurantiaca]